jgi:hypothetical protein
MYTAEHRDDVRQRVLAMAKADPRVTGGALTGSTAFGGGDEWSDIDEAFGIADNIALEAVLEDWTQALDQQFGVLALWDLPSGSSIYRVFLLPGGLEVDISVTPARDFGARGPNFNVLFGNARQQEVAAPVPPDAPYLIGLCWHHVLHARASIERHKPWRAAYWIGELRNHLFTLACIRLGENPYHGRGFDRLPAAVTDPLAATLVRSLDEPELRRALATATACLLAELELWDTALYARLKPILQEFGAP